MAFDMGGSGEALAGAAGTGAMMAAGGATFGVLPAAAMAAQAVSGMFAKRRAKKRANKQKKKDIARINELERRAALDLNEGNSASGMQGGVAAGRVKRLKDDFQHARSQRSVQNAEMNRNARSDMMHDILNMGGSAAGGIAGLFSGGEQQNRYLDPSQKSWT